MSKSSTFPGLGGRRSGRARDNSLDDVLGDLLGSDHEDEPPKRKFGVRSSPVTVPSAKKDDDFYSNLAANFGEPSEMSDVSEADPAELARTLEAADDMDNDLLGSLKKKSSAPAKTEPHKLTKQKTFDSSSSTSKKPEKNTEDLDDELATLLNESLKETKAASTKTTSSVKTTQKNKPKSSSSSFYGEFDEEDPLAGILSDDEDEKPKQKKKTAPVQTPAAEKPPAISSKDSSPVDSSSASGQSARKAPVQRKRDDIDLGDDLDVLDTLGLDDSPRDKKSNKGTDDEIQRAKSKVNDLFGRGSTPKRLDRPPTGERREFVLDKKYTKNKPDTKEGTEEDFSFGGYMPSAATPPGSRGGTAGSRRSVRFADDGDSGGSRGGSNKQSDWLGLGDSQSKSDQTADWLGLTDPEPVKPKPSTTTARTNAPSPSPAAKRNDAKSGDFGSSAGAGYLGLGADVDLDSLAQPQPVTPPKRSTTPDESGLDLFSPPEKKDSSSSFPWESSKRGHPHRRGVPEYRDTQDDYDLDDSMKSPRAAAMADHLAQITKMEKESPRKQEQPRPASSDGAKRVPQWRQEMKQKQQQQHQQQPRPSSRDSAFMSQQPLYSMPTIQPGTDLLKQQDDMQRQMIRQQEEQMRMLQQQQHAALEQQLREQQLKQQEEQHKLQEELLKRQIQNATPQMPLLADMSMNMTALSSQIRRLELEKEYLEMTLDNSKKRFQEDLHSLEATHRRRLKLYEEASDSREKRLKQENEELVNGYTAKMKLLEQQKSDLITSHHRKMMEFEDDKTREINKLKELQRSALEDQVKDHQLELLRLKRSHEIQLDTLKGTHTHTRALQTVIDQVQANAHELGSLQQRVENQHYANLDDREIEARQKDEQLKILQQRLARQQEENDQERSRLQELISRMESHMSEQAKQLEQERWKVKQEQAKLDSLQVALDGERRILTEKLVTERAEIERAKDNLLSEQKTVMAQLYEERKTLATERAQLSATQKVLMETKQRESAKAMQEDAEREGLLRSLAEQKAEAVGKATMLRQEAERLTEQKRTLQHYKEELETEKLKLQDVAEQIRKRSEEVADSVHEAARIKEEGEAAMKTVRQIQGEHDLRLTSVQTQIQLLRTTEKQIAQDRLQLAKEQKALEDIRKTITCTKCGGPTNVYALANPAVLSQSQILQPVSTPPTQQTATLLSTTPVKDSQDAIQELIAQAELDRTLRMWKMSAEKDKAYLEDESFYLETLKNSSLKSSPTYASAQRV
ncbi:fas-binding factor 1 homolog [Glandiceps talaboti]